MKKSLLAVLAVLALLAMVGTVSADPIGTGTVKFTHTTTPSYWAAVVENGGGVIDDGDYLAWCVSEQTMTSGNSYPVQFYDSRENVFASDHPEVTILSWNKINYILNNKDIANNNARAIQAAIWTFDGGVIPSQHSDYDEGGNEADYNAIVAAANEYGASFVPGPGEVYALICYVNENTQTNIIEVEEPPVVPEFPTLAVPVGMLIGMVYTVSVIRGRKPE